jgi:L-asparaginase
MQTSSILIIYTGGTIGMVKDEESGALRPLDTESLFEHIPLLEKFNCRIGFTAFDPLLDSSNIQPWHWVRIVDIIEKHYED